MRPLIAIVVGLLVLAAPSGPLFTQVAVADDQLADRPVSDIQLHGLRRVSEQKVLNNIRSRVGQAYDPETARGDVNRLTRLGDFKSIDVVAELQTDGTVVLRYLFQEEELLAEVSVVGNSMLDDGALLAPTGLHRGSPRDDFLIQRGVRLMEDMYKAKGFYLVEITVDQKQLSDDGVLIYEVIEGPRVRIRAIEFVGTRAFTDKKLRAQIETSTWIPLLERAALDEDELTKDVGKLTAFYRDRGWIDVRVDRTVEISPDQREAKVIFLVEEGQRYTVGRIQVRTVEGGPTEGLSRSQVAAMMTIKVGDAFRADLVRRSMDAVRDAYGVMGWLDTHVRAEPIRLGDTTEIDLLVQIDEGRVADVGLVNITGNTLTQDRVIRGMTQLAPGHRFDVRELKRTEERITQSGLFSEAKVRVQREDPDHPGERDVLIEVKEKNTGSINFGVGLGSDSGVLGNISLTQNNFDVADAPQTLGEFFAGRALRGAGQKFAMNFQPGTEIFSYDISLTEPRFLDTPISLGGAGGFYRRIYEQYTEQRLYGGMTVSRRLGDIWYGDLRLEYTNVRLTEIADDAPDQVRADTGPDNLVSLGGSLVRTTLNSFMRPTAGSRLALSYSNYGAFAGNVKFNRSTVNYTTYLLLDRDFLGRPSTLRLDGRFGLIFGGAAPNYEKFYMGGRSFRGFHFRGIGPKGTLNGVPVDTVVGGDLMCFVGGQYQFPLVGEFLDGVLWTDTGTVNTRTGLAPYRASVGFGFRVYIAALGSAPLAFDFGFPILKQPEDRTQLFSFAADLPF
ncbi:MAG: outer membrane protein assembly factor BamA [Phycisphaerales bacterium]|nr:outer membrane protein assembly factor BamA [Phycisphaerales bacterium]